MLKEKTKELFQELCEDAETWDGIPMWGANVGGTMEDGVLLEDLKENGLVRTTTDEDDGAVWVHFTPTGRVLSIEQHGFDPNPTGRTGEESEEE